MTIVGGQSPSNAYALEPWARGSIGDQPSITLEALQKRLTVSAGNAAGKRSDIVFRKLIRRLSFRDIVFRKLIRCPSFCFAENGAGKRSGVVFGNFIRWLKNKEPRPEVRCSTGAQFHQAKEELPAWLRSKQLFAVAF
jgi:hypothetical protein